MLKNDCGRVCLYLTPAVYYHSTSLMPAMGGAAPIARLSMPQYVGGRWQKARISARNLARLRRAALVAGEEWPLDRPAQPLHINPVAGRRQALQRPARCVRRLVSGPPLFERYVPSMVIAGKPKSRRVWTGCQRSSRSTARCGRGAWQVGARF